ncbi:hypothetical protein JRQ81_013651 [Phrynocephalus forsythii]|uniref:Uncharacterized protein n=1 Tax=Phrynocephalus forsythii TaxID=171643 RepID=A0A9Q0XZJ6_9SAUR|nr:hypothetical protein JRQ81_013651 [Phrynocephalus forsythii]
MESGLGCEHSNRPKQRHLRSGQKQPRARQGSLDDLGPNIQQHPRVSDRKEQFGKTFLTLQFDYCFENNMPIVKVPVVHRFGIVSHDEHQKLQQRLLAKYLKENYVKSKKQKPKNPLELTEEFIEDFNESLETEKKEALIELAKKMLARCKRRLGLSTLGCGKYVDLPLAWTEAIMLAQCKGNISEEALGVLIMSLDHAPVTADHIPVLFFLAESILYKLCHDVVQKPYLFSCEILLYKDPLSELQ